MGTSNYDLTDAEKENCAVNTMRDAVRKLSLREGIPYEEALLRFTSSRVYDALFDYGTGIWREGTDYIVNLYDLVKNNKERM